MAVYTEELTHLHGVVVPGCPACRKVINTSNGFIEHIADDILPGIIEQVMAHHMGHADAKAIIAYLKSLPTPIH